MLLLNWYRDWLELRREYKKEKVCETCETLKIQVEQLRYDNGKLMDRILEKPNTVTEPRIPDNITPILPRNKPWKVIQQSLEAQDRVRAAQLRKDAPKPVIAMPINTETEELEQEILNAEREREAKVSD